MYHSKVYFRHIYLHNSHIKRNFHMEKCSDTKQRFPQSLKKYINDMEWKETGKILKMKWEDVIFLKCSKWAHFHSYHKASGSRAVYSKLREIMKKKTLWKNWNISLGNEIFILKRWEMLVLTLMFWQVLDQLTFC